MGCTERSVRLASTSTPRSVNDVEVPRGRGLLPVRLTWTKHDVLCSYTSYCTVALEKQHQKTQCCQVSLYSSKSIVANFSKPILGATTSHAHNLTTPTKYHTHFIVLWLFIPFSSRIKFFIPAATHLMSPSFHLRSMIFMPVIQYSHSRMAKSTIASDVL